MCGIAGFVGRGSKSVLQNMIRKINYRGPDYIGTYYQDGVGLAQSRLSIVDLDSRSNQPFFSPDRRYAIVFNGEIYNYLRLKKELEKLNKYSFHTTSDTEVLLYLYIEYGIAAFRMLEGMFALAIYDFESRQLVAVRDRMGKKPFYYTLRDGNFVFGSELKVIQAYPEIELKYNYDAINQYLTMDYIPCPNTLYQNIYKLEPAHYLVFQDHEIKTKSTYWNYQYEPKTEMSFDEAKNHLDALMQSATRDRLMGDVPLGVFLSGGLDSSAVAYYAQQASLQKIKTFSIGFEDKSYNELDYASQVANHLGTDHYYSILTPKHSLKLIDEVFSKLDEPFADASIIPTYYLSQFTRQHVTVALGGDGSDELLAGYPTFISEKTRKSIQLLPKSVIKILYQSARQLLKPSDDNISFDFKVKQFLQGFLSNPRHTHPLWLGSFTPDAKKELLHPDIYLSLKDRSGLGIIDYHFDYAKDLYTDSWHEIIYYYCQTYLLDDILFKVDRASMYNSLEVRAPFLDVRVVEFINSLPIAYKMNGWNGKYILKKMMESKLPHNIIYRPKKGFGIPLSSWIKKDLKNEIEGVVLQNDNLFNRNVIERLLKEHHSEKANHRKLIWNLYCLKKIIP